MQTTVVEIPAPAPVLKVATRVLPVASGEPSESDQEKAGEFGLEVAPAGEPVIELSSSEVLAGKEDLTGPSTVERYSQVVKDARLTMRARNWTATIDVLSRGLELEDLVGEQRAWLLYLRAKAERRLGHTQEAVKLYSEAIDFDPPGTHYKNSLAWVLATVRKPGLRDVPRAVRLAEEAVQEGGGRAQYLDTLARAYFEAGRVGDAVLAQEKAVAKAPREAYRNRLNWYLEEAGQTPVPAAGE
jgi:tetratricopeptide (TPR) repeat protein